MCRRTNYIHQMSCGGGLASVQPHVLRRYVRCDKPPPALHLWVWTVTTGCEVDTGYVAIHTITARVRALSAVTL